MNTEIKMIDQIQKTIGKIDPQQNKASKATEDVKFKSAPVTGADDSISIDTANISSIAKSEKLNELASSAPIDIEQVKDIKNAIANGDYPIDIDRIADALMDVYRDMKS